MKELFAEYSAAQRVLGGSLALTVVAGVVSMFVGHWALGLLCLVPAGIYGYIKVKVAMVEIDAALANDDDIRGI